MAGEHCEAGYWIVWSQSFDGPTEVEHVATFEQARARWQALAASEAIGPEVSGADGVVLLHEDMDRFEMTAPKRPGRYLWLDEERGFEVLA